MFMQKTNSLHLTTDMHYFVICPNNPLQCKVQTQVRAQVTILHSHSCTHLAACSSRSMLRNTSWCSFSWVFTSLILSNVSSNRSLTPAYVSIWFISTWSTFIFSPTMTRKEHYSYCAPIIILYKALMCVSRSWILMKIFFI